MMRRHPGASVAAALYGGGIVLFSLVPWRGYANGAGVAAVADRMGLAGMRPEAADLVVNAILFLPLGVLLAAVGGRRHRAAAVGAAVLVAFWVELAQAVWLPQRDPSMICAGAQIGGAALGVLLVTLLQHRTHRDGRVQDEAAASAADRESRAATAADRESRAAAVGPALRTREVSLDHALESTGRR